MWMGATPKISNIKMQELEGIMRENLNILFLFPQVDSLFFYGLRLHPKRGLLLLLKIEAVLITKSAQANIVEE